ncbi:MAG: hypothetical protein ABIV94_00685 [Acidimicrobiales bacterium]
MSARTVRRVVIVVCVAGIGGMVAGSIVDRVGVAITSGAVTAVAVLGLILVTAAAGPAAFGAPTVLDDEAAADLERRIGTVVDQGAEETEVRSLVRAAVRFGRGSPPPA